ncbi:MAG TPA: hypothetical protein VFR24_00100 [Candidatus Angelobacter sp.]|nr:hypothetical protein [Candidatus Angelobacter sp.]
MALTDTEKILIKMLKENTGRAMCDSGSAYGRNWERNQARKFQKEPSALLDIFTHRARDYWKEDTVELSPVVSVFHFLSEALEYSPKIDRQLQSFARRVEFENEPWLSIAEAFAQHYADQQESKPPVNTVNTYNGEDFLSQVLQYVMVGEDEGVVVLSIHGGCDVRGGYTKPRVFRYSTDWYPSIFDNARASIICTGEKRHGWSIEPGYSQSFSDEPDLKDIPNKILAQGEQPEIGKLCAREDDSEAYCPVCAAKLEASM